MNGGFAVDHEAAFAHKFAGFGFFGDLIRENVENLGDGVAQFPGFGVDGDGLGTFVNGCLRRRLTVFDEKERRSWRFGVKD